jgi:hypothetical protein
MTYQFIFTFLSLAVAGIRAQGMTASCKHIPDLFQARDDLLKARLELDGLDASNLFAIQDLAEKVKASQIQGKSIHCRLSMYIE